jgi:ribokinase
VLCPNEVETELLLGDVVPPGGEAAAAAELLARGVGAVILTLGERGCLVHTATESVLLPAKRVEARDTTGAGDAFVGSFAYFLARGETLSEAAARANRIAGISVQAPGTQTSFRSAASLPAELLAAASVRAQA